MTAAKPAAEANCRYGLTMARWPDIRHCDFHKFLIASHVGLALTVLCVMQLGCDSHDAADEGPQPSVLVDSRSKETFLLPLPESFPAVNPTTQKRTLMPGLYCSECQQWYPVPPPDQINRQRGAAVCPKSHGPLTADGPRPE